MPTTDAHVFTLKNGKKIRVSVSEGKKGGVLIRSTIDDVTTVTCTCGGTSVTTTCPSDDNNTCDCSDPAHPKVICG